MTRQLTDADFLNRLATLIEESNAGTAQRLHRIARTLGKEQNVERSFLRPGQSYKFATSGGTIYGKLKAVGKYNLLILDDKGRETLLYKSAIYAIS
jgi:hypothetical protein